MSKYLAQLSPAPGQFLEQTALAPRAEHRREGAVRISQSLGDIHLNRSHRSSLCKSVADDFGEKHYDQIV